MKYIIEFTMKGNVAIEAEDIPEAIEEIELYSKSNLSRKVTEISINSVKSEDGKETVSF